MQFVGQIRSIAYKYSLGTSPVVRHARAVCQYPMSWSDISGFSTYPANGRFATESAQRRGRRSLHFNRSGRRRWGLGNELLRSVA
jgi:hypothetical protein